MNRPKLIDHGAANTSRPTPQVATTLRHRLGQTLSQRAAGKEVSRALVACGVGCWVGCLVGCTSLALPNPSGWTSRSEKPEIPTRMVAVWTDTIMNQPGRRGVRGVGGRILFYAGQEESPVRVSGKLTVYAYDDSESVQADAPPARKYVFLPEQLGSHQSTSTMGSSYNVWLPWNEVGNPERQLTLIARFEPEQGATVMSDPARQMLPGVAAPSQVKKSVVQTAPQLEHPHPTHIDLVSHEEAVAASLSQESPAAAKDRLATFTIDLPTDVARRWQTPLATTAKTSVVGGTLDSAANALTTKQPQLPASEHGPSNSPRRVESASARPPLSRRAAARELPSQMVSRSTRRRSAAASRNLQPPVATVTGSAAASPVTPRPGADR